MGVAWQTFGVVLLLLLSGCAGSEETPAAAVQFVAGSCSYDADAGAVSGRVLNEELMPLADAKVQLRELSRETSTAADGGFCFSDVAAGRYTIDLLKLGYNALSRAIDVAPGRISTLSAVLKAIPPLGEPRSEILGPFQGFMECRMATVSSSGQCGFLPVVGNVVSNSTGPILFPNDKIFYDFTKITAKDWSQIVFESRWKPSTYATNPKMTQVFSYTNRTSTHWFADSGPQNSPIKFVYQHGKAGPGGQLQGNQPKEPNANITLRTWITVPFSPATHPVDLAFELRFQIMVTIVYNDEAAADYTAFTDSA